MGSSSYSPFSFGCRNCRNCFLVAKLTKAVVQVAHAEEELAGARIEAEAEHRARKDAEAAFAMGCHRLGSELEAAQSRAMEFERELQQMRGEAETARREVHDVAGSAARHMAGLRTKEEGVRRVLEAHLFAAQAELGAAKEAAAHAQLVETELNLAKAPEAKANARGLQTLPSPYGLTPVSFKPHTGAELLQVLPCCGLLQKRRDSV